MNTFSKILKDTFITKFGNLRYTVFKSNHKALMTKFAL